MDLLDQTSLTVTGTYSRYVMQSRSNSVEFTAILRHRLNWQQKAIIMEDRFDVVSGGFLLRLWPLTFPNVNCVQTEIRSTINAMKIGYKDPDAYVDVKPRP